MATNTIVSKSMLGASAASFVLGIALLSAPAMAQEATPAGPPNGPSVGSATAPVDQPATAATASDDEPGTIVVTGTLFRRTNTETPSPVTVLTADTLQKAGITNVNDAIRSVSADSAGSISTGFQNGFSGGGAAVSLRGLGVSSTLVLVDGLRSTNFPLNDDGHNGYVDLNSVPFSIIDRVEVLKDGASSTYGADAIGGVVNLILKKHFTGVAGTVEGGLSERGDASKYRANLTAGYGDYASQGFNIYVNAEYQRDGAVSVKDRGFPNDTFDLSPIGGIDNNSGDSDLTIATTNAVVVRAGQTDLNNPLSGSIGAPLGSQYVTLNLANCAAGTYTSARAGQVGSVGCRHNNITEFASIQPRQQRYSATGRVSVRLSDNIEGYVTGSWSHSEVNVIGTGAASPAPSTNPGPRPIRSLQPFGAPSALASINPGIVLPVYVCSAGVNCATAADRRLNPNNPFAAAFAGTPNLGAARIYYLFGDIPFGSDRKNDVYRATAGLNGSFGGDKSWDWRVEGVYARDNFKVTDYGWLNVAGVRNAINTGSYNFVDPSQNSQAVRDSISPKIVTPSHTSLASAEASVSHAFFDLPGGPLQVSVGGQVRREVLVNNSRNPDLATYGLNPVSARGKHTVSAGYFEIDAPVFDQLDLNASGRYDHYSEGFSHFSPKFGAKFTPIKEVALRGTYSKGFRAPTFAELGSTPFPGCSNVTPPANFVAAHGGSSNPYAQAYSVCQGNSGNPNLKPELSRSFTGGIIAQPVRWLSLTVDYYNVKKSRLIVASPLYGAARNAYFSQDNLAAATAAVAAVGPGISVNAVDAADPLYPNALPRVLIISVPFVNASSESTSGLDFSATASVPLTPSLRFVSRVDVTDIFKFDLHPGDGTVQKYVGTLGPYELSSGAGTPKWRGSWQNTLETDKFSISATAYYVSHIKNVAADEGSTDLSCDQNLYGTGDKFCYIKRFINVDLNGSIKVNDAFTFYVNVGNVFDAKAPLAPSSYSGINYLPTWHLAGIIGRTFSAGANFKF